MRLLVDANALIWWLDRDRRLSAVAAQALTQGRVLPWVSVVTIWEIAVKRESGRLTAPANFDEWVQGTGLFRALGFTIEHALAAAALPMHHRDPFDRMLVAQARLEGLTIVTRDAKIARYDVPVIAA